MILISTDWHLTDQPEDEYRWRIINHTQLACAQYDISRVFVLGDITDRKDRFSASFVNRLANELTDLHQQANCPIVIIKGNHDTALRPPNFFEFLNLISGIEYISQPTSHGDLLLLPYTPNPKEDWKDYRIADYKAIFMHATVTGSIINDGVVLDNPNMPVLPRRPKIYSGDIHHQQQVGPVTYIGACHPVKFGDNYACRMLLLDEQTYEIAHEIELPSTRKIMADIHSFEDLQLLTISHGDQIKIRLHSNPDQVDDLAQTQAAIAEWARENRLTIAGTEIIIHTTREQVDINQSPESILRQFADQQGLSEDVLAMGLELLREVE